MLKNEEVRTRFGWAFLGTAVGLKMAVTSSANWKSNRSLALSVPHGI